MKTAEKIAALLQHLNLAMGIVILTLFITDRFNRAMAFLANETTRWLVAVFALMVITETVLSIVIRYRKKS